MCDCLLALQGSEAEALALGPAAGHLSPSTSVATREAQPQTSRPAQPQTSTSTATAGPASSAAASPAPPGPRPNAWTAGRPVIAAAASEAARQAPFSGPGPPQPSAALTSEPAASPAPPHAPDTAAPTPPSDSQLTSSAAGPATPGAAGSEYQALLAQARRSAFDPATSKVRCRACGRAFATFGQLAQHLGSAHGGLNSEDAKVIAFKQAGRAAAPAPAQLLPLVSEEAFPAMGAAVAAVGRGRERGARPPGASGAAEAPGAGLADEAGGPAPPGNAWAARRLATAAPAGLGAATKSLEGAEPVASGRTGRVGAAGAAAVAGGAARGAWSLVAGRTAHKSHAVGGAAARSAAPPAAAAAPGAAAPGGAAGVRPSRRVVTLADLLLTSAPARHGSKAAAAQAQAPRAGRSGAGGRAAAGGAAGGGVRVLASNALRVAAVAGGGSAARGAAAAAPAGAVAVAPRGKRLRLTPEGEVAPRRKKPLSKAKRLVVQHRAGRSLVAALAEYERLASAYRCVLEGVLGVLRELRGEGGAVPQEPLGAGGGGSLLGDRAVGVEGDGAGHSGDAGGASGEATAAAGRSGGAGSGPALAAASAVAAVGRSLPAPLRPALESLVLFRTGPRLAALWRRLQRRRSVVKDALAQQAKVRVGDGVTVIALSDILVFAAGQGARRARVLAGGGRRLRRCAGLSGWRDGASPVRAMWATKRGCCRCGPCSSRGHVRHVAMFVTWPCSSRGHARHVAMLVRRLARAGQVHKWPEPQPEELDAVAPLPPPPPPVQPPAGAESPKAGAGANAAAADGVARAGAPQVASASSSDTEDDDDDDEDGAQINQCMRRSACPGKDARCAGPRGVQALRGAPSWSLSLRARMDLHV
jgi:hypothetical protein